MKVEFQRYMGLLERRLAALRLLAKDLEESRAAYVTLDLQAIRLHTAYQENLCAEIRSLDVELEDVRAGCSSGIGAQDGAPSVKAFMAEFDSTSAENLQALLRAYRTIQVDLKRLCRVHSELLRRSRRSVNVLLNFLAHYSGTYSAPTNTGRLHSLQI